MTPLRICGLVAAALLCCCTTRGQSTCALAHPDLGVHICFPPTEESKELPSILHVSAQINAPEGETVKSFTIWLDRAPVGQEVERVPARRVSVEGNLGSPLPAGKHVLTIKAPKVGEATANIVTGESPLIAPCDPVTNFPHWDCISRPAVRGSKEVPLFTLARVRVHRADAASLYAEYQQAFLDELEALQLDIMEVAAFDRAGNLYLATHARSDIEVRKYSPGGQKLEFATIVNSCGSGFTALDAMAVNDEGQVWIAGHSDACFQASENALQHAPAQKGEMRAFVLSVSTRPGIFPALRFFTYISPSAAERIGALRVDSAGNAYIVGTTTSVDFPHQVQLTVDSQAPSSYLSFAAILNSDGSALLGSSLLRGVLATGIGVGEKNVFIAGRASASGFLRNSTLRRGSAAEAHSSGEFVCCLPFAASLAKDLSSLTAATLLSATPVAGSPSLAMAALGQIVVTAVPSRTPSSGKRTMVSGSSQVLYSWLPSSPSRVCSQILPGHVPPSVVNDGTLQAFVRDFDSPICNTRAKQLFP